MGKGLKNGLSLLVVMVMCALLMPISALAEETNTLASAVVGSEGIGVNSVITQTLGVPAGMELALDEAIVSEESGNDQIDASAMIETKTEATYYWPTPGNTNITQPYGAGHKAIDISPGNDVCATKSGTVVKVFSGCTNNNGASNPCTSRGGCSPNAGYWSGWCNGAYGNGVVINHGDGTYSHYAHLLNTFVSVGQNVSQGTVIGTMGSTGCSTGKHLHFAVSTSPNAAVGELNTNPGSGINYTYNITPVDSTPPSISNVQITDVNAEGFTVRCNVSDNVGVTRVNYATWTDANGQDDLKFTDGWIANNDSSYRVLYSDHNNEKGHYWVDIRAYDAAGNMTLLNSYGTEIDTIQPAISNIQFTDVNTEGFTVRCNVSDNVGVTRVNYATWTDANGQDDLKFTDGWIANNDSSYRVLYSDHNNGKGHYWVDIRAYDAAGNMTLLNSYGTDIDATPPVISNVKVSDITSTGYTVMCIVTDNNGIDRVQFPTWTLDNAQDDLTGDWQTNPKYSGIINGDTVTYRVEDSEHNYEKGVYRTHIYAFDKFGNKSVIKVEDVESDTTLTNSGTPVASEIINHNEYQLMDDAMTWSEARSKAETMGGHLVTITSLDEQSVIEKLLQSGQRSNYFIGGTDAGHEGTFTWITGEAFSFTKWLPGNPDNYQGDENYLEVKNNEYYKGNWNDIPGNIKGGFIVEKEGTGLSVDSFIADPSTDLYANTSISLTAKVTGGSKPYQYKFTAKRGDVTSVLKDYSETSAAIFKPAEAGDYTLTVEVKDAAGNTGSKSINIQISEAPVTESKFVAFLGKDPQGNFYEYSADSLNKSYLAYQINPALASAKMYQQFLTSQCRVVALKDGAKGYMDYNGAATASLMAQMKGETFYINAYLAGSEAKKLAENVGVVKTVDKDGNVQ